MVKAAELSVSKLVHFIHRHLPVMQPQQRDMWYFEVVGSLYSGQLSNFEALTGRDPAILDCFDCEQTLCQHSNIIQGNSTPPLSQIQGSSLHRCKLRSVI